VRATFAAVFAAFPDARWNDGTHSGDRGVSEWVCSGTDAEDGATIEEKGCDIFTFRDGKIAVKNTGLKSSP